MFQDGTTALHYGCTNGHISVCRLLINAGSRIDDTNTVSCAFLPFRVCCFYLQKLYKRDVPKQSATTPVMQSVQNTKLTFARK